MSEITWETTPGTYKDNSMPELISHEAIFRYAIDINVNSDFNTPSQIKKFKIIKYHAGSIWLSFDYGLEWIKVETDSLHVTDLSYLNFSRTIKVRWILPKKIDEIWDTDDVHFPGVRAAITINNITRYFIWK